MAKKIHLVVIDPQVDFCDPKGALYVKGADKDMERLANMVKRLSRKLDDIHVTLDSHHPIHIAHPMFWKNSAGSYPKPFTIISPQDVKDGTWTPVKPKLFQWGKEYVDSLAKNNRYPLCIWPPHCLIGSVGQTVYPVFYEALMEWCRDSYGNIDFVTKGSNYKTEHYSAIVADVTDPEDPGTAMNVRFLDTINEADIVLLAGEARSHCLANTGRDACNYFSDDSLVKKLVLIEDATSDVTGFENYGEQFVKEMKARGMQTTTCKDFLA